MSRRLPPIAFGLLALATIGAFFLVQRLKTAPPLVWTVPTPTPSAFNPISGRPCRSRPTKLHPHGVMLNYRRSTITFSLSHADTVGVYIVSAKYPAGNTVDTITGGTPMLAARGSSEDTMTFSWNGRLDDGQVAPDGTYYFRIVLEREGRSANFSHKPVQVITTPPKPRILSVRTIEQPHPSNTGAHSGTASTGTASTDRTSTGTTTNGTTTTRSGTTTSAVKSGGALLLRGPAVVSPPHGSVRITFARGSFRRASIDIYRTDVSGGPEFVDSFPITRLGRNWIDWNGEIGKTPAAAGTYLIGITAQNLACTQGSWPTMPLVAGSTAHAGVTVRYLSVTPPLTPTVSGGRARVAVDSAGIGVSWQLRRTGRANVLARGSRGAGSGVIRVPMPRREPGLYTLTVHAGAQSAVVPLVASQAGPAAAHARVLVVLPTLTWMGDTPVDDSGDGIPDTLRAGIAVSLKRPLVDGLPVGFGEDATLLEYLAAHHLSYQLTTDVALAQGVGPSLADRGGVIFPAGEAFVPAGLESILRGFVRGGGRALVLGTGDFSGVSHVTGFPAAPRAGSPHLTGVDPFGARRGPVTPTGGQSISSDGDDFALFTNAGEFSGFNQYQPIQPPPSTAGGSVSVAGIGSGTPAIIAFHYGSGTVIEVGLGGFAASLLKSADSDNLLNNAWRLLSQ